MKDQHFDTAFETVKKLVAKFKQGERHYLSQSYQEAELRQDFLDDFFTALGWDVGHKIQHDPYEQEVKVERGVKVSGAQKRADYSFAIAPNFRDPKFFAEAKKPIKDLRNAQDYFQSIRYGWHKAHPLSILTDFEEFHILDCRYTPDINNSLDKCFRRFHYTDYLNKEKFAEIYFLFSREAVANNSIEKVAEILPKKRGRATAKALFPLEIHQTIDEAFLEEIDNVREKLAKAFKRQDEDLTSEQLTEATQRTVDRLVFIRFLEDKLIEPEHYVSEFGEKGSVWNDFISACRKLDAKYNGIVFKHHFIDKQTFAGPEDNEFRSICQDMCHLNSRFLFNEIPIHILGSIYERFLGKVIHATAKQATVKVKDEVRKAGGVYYTPKYVVDYIVRKTVGELIEGKRPDQIEKLRFADVACGSGSFLISVFECLLDYHNKYYQKHPDQAKKDKCIKKDGLWVLSIKQKQKILLNNVFGVDIDQQATEVTQLSLALKMLEDETTATANDMQVLFHERILPDMTGNILCGNSLIGTDILTQDLFAGEEERKLNPMNFGDVFKDENGKCEFDAIVGNPPYGFHQIHTDIIKPYLKTHYYSSKGSFEHYFLFYERTLKLLKKNGLHGYIVPVTWLTIPSAKSLREFILDNYFIKEIDWLPELVFKNAQVNTLISIIQKSDPGYTHINIYDTLGFSVPPKATKVIEQRKFVSSDYYIGIFENEVDEVLIEKILMSSNQLREICRPCSGYNPYEVGAGIAPNGKPHTKETVKTKPYHSEFKKGEEWKPEITGRDLTRYFVNVTGKRWVKYGPWLSAARDPNNFLGKRILVQEITGGKEKRIIAGYFDKELYHSRDVIPIKIEGSSIDPYYILAFINSKLISWYHHKRNPKAQKGLFPKVLVGDLAKLPIKKIDFENSFEKLTYNKIIDLVAKMLQAKKETNTDKTEKDKTYTERKCSSLDSAIDSEIYRLYGLSDDEIKIIEGK